MFALRLCIPEVIYLTPLLQREVPLIEFLTRRIIECFFLKEHKSFQDEKSHIWWSEMMPHFHCYFFGECEAVVLNRIEWHLKNIDEWLPVFLQYISTLSWTDWNRLDVSLQRLYVLLDYENEKNWGRVLGNPKYIGCLAKAVLFCLEQWEGIVVP